MGVSLKKKKKKIKKKKKKKKKPPNLTLQYRMFLVSSNDLKKWIFGF
ncbi:hypothetical protein HanIR_Chr16g0797201 [Helianthus annuus]|nr:hypothetical protein HanIR_Chr16g0797201 [Helianthus annuus]